MKKWISISKYSKIYNISVSTLRRRIKNNKIKYIKEKGQYKIQDMPLVDYHGTTVLAKETKSFVNETLKTLVQTQKELLTEKDKNIEDLQKEIIKQAEEIIELKMLVQILEEEQK